MKDEIIEKSIRCDCIGGEHYLQFAYFEDENQHKDLVDVDLPPNGD